MYLPVNLWATLFSVFCTGKTEITKMLVAQIVRMSQWEGDYFLQEKIIEVMKSFKVG